MRIHGVFDVRVTSNSMYVVFHPNINIYIFTHNLQRFILINFHVRLTHCTLYTVHVSYFIANLLIDSHLCCCTLQAEVFNCVLLVTSGQTLFIYCVVNFQNCLHQTFHTLFENTLL